MAILTNHCSNLPDELYISYDLHKWTTTRLQYQNMSLTVYQSKFVLVGGRHPSTRKPTNIVLTSPTGKEWESSLPPMPTKRCATSSMSTRSPEILVVAGGVGLSYKHLDVIEVFIGKKWTVVDSLPVPNNAIHSILHDGNLYFIYEHAVIYTCNCASLISSCEKSSSHTPNRQLWKIFQAPRDNIIVVSYSSRLASINGGGTVRCVSSTHNSWIETTSEGDRPHDYSKFAAASVLPTGDIVYAHKYGGIYRIIVSGK